MKETIRQLVHLIFGLGIAFFLYFSDRSAAIAVLTLSVFLGVIFSDAIAKGYRIPLISWIVNYQCPVCYRIFPKRYSFHLISGFVSSGQYIDHNWYQNRKAQDLQEQIT